MADQQIQGLPPGAVLGTSAATSTAPPTTPSGSQIQGLPPGAVLAPQSDSQQSQQIIGLPPGAVVGGEEAETSLPEHGLMGRIVGGILKGASAVVDTIPGASEAHTLATAGENAANAEAQKLQEAQLARTAKTGEVPSGISRYLSPESAMRAIGSLAGIAAGATTPEGLATTAATVALPEVMGPLLMAHGAYNMYKGWGDLRNPDVLENELSSAAELIGGATAVTEGGARVKQHLTNKAAGIAPADAIKDIKNSIPPSRTAPYEDRDVAAAQPYLEAENKSGMPITSVESLRDAADSAIGKIENQVNTAVKQNPHLQLSFLQVIPDVTNMLKSSLRADFFDAGMKDLMDKWPQLNGPLTLEDADAIRADLNAENRAAKALNKYRYADAMKTDPAFAAREAAADSLRDGIYKGLEELGFKDAAEWRLNEGSLIKIRNAAERQIFAGERQVRATGAGNIAKKVAKGAVKEGARVAGLGAGAAMGHPMLGYVGGSMAGEAASHFMPEANLTRDELASRAFAPKPQAAPIAPRGAGAVAQGAVAGAANDENRIMFRASDGSLHSVPADQIGAAQHIDPRLEILATPHPSI